MYDCYFHETKTAFSQDVGQIISFLLLSMISGVIYLFLSDFSFISHSLDLQQNYLLSDIFICP